ncbi:glycosyltransferase family 4 protein [Candidatus Peregrinibacteria bacterium]|nr:MAG: glycosyltransferase family 4 protein [Candidatus Peregrinibacteria bacterium]
MKTLAKARLLVTRFPYRSQWGGEELHTLTLVKELDKKGVPSFYLGSCPVLGKAFKEAHFDVKWARLGKPPVTKFWLLAFTMLSPLLFVKAGLLLWRARRRWGVTAVLMLSLGEKLLMTPWAHFFGMRTLWIEHARIGRWITKNPWRGVYRWCSRWATVVVTSNAMVGYVRPLISERGVSPRLAPISCAVMVEKASELRPDLLKFLSGAGGVKQPEWTSPFVVSTVARLTPDKGVDMLVHLVHSKPEVRLVVVGEGPLKKALENKADLSRVRFVNSLPRGELMELYKRSDLFVLASREMDPFGMVAAEAMHFGTPVLLTNVCGIAADLVHSRDAWIVEPRVAELDKAFKRLQKDPVLRAALGKHGQAFVKSHYRLDSMVGEFEGLLAMRK